MKPRSPRIAARALVLQDDRLLVVNAWPGTRSDLWCAPGGGVHSGASLHDNLTREVHEETGITIQVGSPVLINEFHDPVSGFHQIEVFFRCEALGPVPAEWTDPEGIVTVRRFVTRAELQGLRHKPDGLAAAAWDRRDGAAYDPLEEIVR